MELNLLALKSRTFRLYLAGNFFALNALWILRIIVGWLAWDLTGSAGFVGLIASCYFLPSLFLGPLFGVLTDRADVRRAAIVVQSLFFASAIALWIAQVFGDLGALHLLLYAVASGMIMSAHGPVRMSMAPRLVELDKIPSAVNFASINYNVSRMTGPAIGGLAIVQIGTELATFLSALCYLPFLAALFHVRVRQAGARPSTHGFRRDLAEGARCAFGDAGIRAALAFSSVTSIFLLGLLEILPAIADGVFAKGAVGLGLLTASAGLGAIVVGLGMLLLPPVFGPNCLQLAAAIGMFGVVCMAVLGQASSWPVTVGLVAATSAAASASGIICQLVIQTQIGDRMRGRVMSIWASVAIGSSAIGAAALGLAVDYLGLGTALMLGAVVAGLLLTAGLVRGSRRIRPSEKLADFD